MISLYGLTYLSHFIISVISLIYSYTHLSSHISLVSCI